MGKQGEAVPTSSIIKGKLAGQCLPAQPSIFVTLFRRLPVFGPACPPLARRLPAFAHPLARLRGAFFHAVADTLDSSPGVLAV